MKKAMMYLLLALGIIIAVVFVSGAVMGFAAGFIDGYNEAHPDTTQASSLIVCSGVVFALLACAILNWVFLHFRFASYTGGRMPKEASWRVLPLLMLVMGGMALVYSIMYNPLIPYDGTLNTESDQNVRDYYLMIKNNPLFSLPMLVLVEGTADLILFGAVLREILEWKHKPEIIIPVFAGLMGLFSGLWCFLQHHCKIDYIVAEPRMAEYIRISAKIYEIAQRYAAPDDIQAIKDGTLAGSVAQYPDIQAEAAIQACLDVLAGQKLEAHTKTKAALVTADNVEAYEAGEDI